MAAYLILTKADRLILDSYKTVLDGFSEYFGEGYELVLHSLEDLEHSVIKIINGHYTNREEGRQSPIWRLRCWSGLENRVPPLPCLFQQKEWQHS